MLIHSSSKTDDQTIQQRISLIKTIQREAENIVWHNAKLNHEQLQLLLNISCTSFALVLAEHKLLQEAQFIFPMTWHMRYHNEKPVITAEHLLILERSLARFSNLYKTRQQLRDALSMLTNSILNPENKAIAMIVEKMTDHSTHLVNYFAHQESASFQEVLHDAESTFAESALIIKSASSNCHSLIDDTYPLKVQSPKNKELVIMESAYNLIDSIAQKAYEAMEATDLLANKIKDCQEFGSLAFYIYFMVTHDGMKERGVDDNYFGMLFENNILISSDSKLRTLKEPIFDTNIPFFN